MGTWTFSSASGLSHAVAVPTCRSLTRAPALLLLAATVGLSSFHLHIGALSLSCLLFSQSMAAALRSRFCGQGLSSGFSMAIAGLVVDHVAPSRKQNLNTKECALFLSNSRTGGRRNSAAEEDSAKVHTTIKTSRLWAMGSP